LIAAERVEPPLLLIVETAVQRGDRRGEDLGKRTPIEFELAFTPPPCLDGYEQAA
jgi:hypothetical protein